MILGDLKGAGFVHCSVTLLCQPSRAEQRHKEGQVVVAFGGKVVGLDSG